MMDNKLRDRLIRKGLVQFTDEQLQRVIEYEKPFLRDGCLINVQTGDAWPMVVAAGVDQCLESLKNQKLVSQLHDYDINPSIAKETYTHTYCGALLDSTDESIKTVARQIINSRKRKRSKWHDS